MIKQLKITVSILSVFTIFINPVFAIEPLDRVDIKNPRMVNSFGSKILDQINVNQQVQITAEIKNNQEKTQEFSYIVQIKNQNNVVISISWITGSLSAGQSFTSALSWAPRTSGEYTAEIFVWDVETIINNNGNLAKIVKNDALSDYKILKIIS